MTVYSPNENASQDASCHVLDRELERYLALRRGLGYGLQTEERILRRFLAFAREQGADHVTVALFEHWRASFGHASPATWAARLGTVRGFARWLRGSDPAHEVPPPGQVYSRVQRTRPYIYSSEEVAGILAETAALPSPLGVRGLTYTTLFGLIAATGLRVSEALSLDESDFSRRDEVLTIRHGKWDTCHIPCDYTAFY